MSDPWVSVDTSPPAGTTVLIAIESRARLYAYFGIWRAGNDPIFDPVARWEYHDGEPIEPPHVVRYWMPLPPPPEA